MSIKNGHFRDMVTIEHLIYKKFHAKTETNQQGFRQSKKFWPLPDVCPTSLIRPVSNSNDVIMG